MARRSRSSSVTAPPIHTASETPPFIAKSLISRLKQYAETLKTPFFGALHSGRLLYGLGYTGHGVGTTRVAGRLLAHLALERRSELAELALVRKPPFPYPPEPLRRWAIGAVTRSLRRVDEGGSPGFLLRVLDRLGIGFSS